MCGIVGIYDLTASTPQEQLLATATAMADTVAHRGPDDAGVWADERAGLALGHRRLAIRDLSPTGHQPMVSSCGRYVIVYNGEIYSQDAIVRDLGARVRTLRGHSDTEVILEACAEWGVEATVHRLIGMFAFALVDRLTGRLTLVRDRLGIKPLYWARSGSSLAFGSELTAIRAAGTIPLTLDRDALAGYFRYNYVGAPATVYQGVSKLSPGTILTVEASGETRESQYWSLDEVSRRPRHPLSPVDTRDRLDELDALLVDAVSRRLVSDVPIGSLLSGGIDSSLVTALMVEASPAPVRTFTVGFEDPAYDEAASARAVAGHLGTEHHEIVATPQDVMRLVDDIPRFYDEPFADVSQLPTMLVSELTRREVTVVLTGDGGDELFGGYSRYAAIELARARGRRIPGPLRPLMGQAITRTPASLLDRMALLAPARLRREGMGRKAHLVGAGLAADDFGPMYDALLSHWPDPASVVVGSRYEAREPARIPVSGSLRDVRDAMRREDMQHYLPDDILTKVDRASMRVALEARVPLLDHRVVELGWALPSELLVRDGVGKWPLRRSLYRRVPQALVDRPKMGFGVPIGDWLRGPLRAWASDLLDPAGMARQGVLDAQVVQRAWQQHQAGAENGYLLWDVLVLQMWLERNASAIG